MACATRLAKALQSKLHKKSPVTSVSIPMKNEWMFTLKGFYLMFVQKLEKHILFLFLVAKQNIWSFYMVSSTGSNYWINNTNQSYSLTAHNVYFLMSLLEKKLILKGLPEKVFEFNKTQIFYEFIKSRNCQGLWHTLRSPASCSEERCLNVFQRDAIT